MYSTNDDLESAWQDLFLITGKLSSGLSLPIHFLNSIEENDIVSSQTRISHICGLPLVSQFQNKLIPICTPHFDLEGLEGPNYFSYFMVSKKSQIKSLSESKGLVAAISSYDSQSGCNVFRSEIEVTKKLGVFDNFYKKIVTTGSHKNSIQKIINNEVDIACIDAISYKNIKSLKVVVPTGEDCPDCGNPLVKRKGRFGEFISCSTFPKCKYTKTQHCSKQTHAHCCRKPTKVFENTNQYKKP